MSLIPLILQKKKLLGSKLNLLFQFIKRVSHDSGILYSRDSASRLFIYLKANNLLETLLALPAAAGKAEKLYSMLPESGDSDFAVSRAGTATILNKNGNVENVDEDVPRIDFLNGNPVLLIEGAGENLLVQSEQFNWLTGRATITANNITSPDGNETGAKFAFTTDGNDCYITQNVTTTAQNYTASFFAKAGSIDKVAFANATKGKGIGFDLTNGTTFAYLNDPISSSITAIGNGWYYCTITGDATAGINVFRFYLSKAFDAAVNDYVYIWGAQLEPGNNATSYMKSTSINGTRNADVITVTSPAETNKITEFFEDGTTNDITEIPATYQIGIGRIEKVVFFSL